MPKNSSVADTTVSENASNNKSYGRKTGWCGNPNSADPKSSHKKCDGIWWISKEGVTLHCPCDCHEITELKIANAKKATAKKKTTTKRPTEKRSAKKKTNSKKSEPKKKKKTTRKKAPKITSCKEHPKYGGIRKPRSGCKTCMKVYENNRA